MKIGAPPPGLRLLRTAVGGRAPAPPFGIRAFDDAAAAVAVALAVPASWPSSGFGDVAEIAQQLPSPGALPPGTLVVLLAEADAAAESSRSRLVARLFRARPSVARAVRGSALLARGYARIGADEGEDVVWAYSS